MKLISGSLLIALVSSAAWAAAPQPAAHAPAPQAEASAPVGERLDLARKFVALTMNEDIFLEGMRAVALQAVSQRVLSSEDGADTPPDVIEEGVDMAFAKFKPVLHARMPKLLEAYAQAYAREFSADELRAMTAFASSPAGKHYLTNPDFGFDDEGVVKAQMELQEAMRPIGEEIQKEACAKKAAARVAAGDKKATCPLSANPTRDG